MRYFRLFLLHTEHIFEHRSRSFVWFLTSLFPSFLLLLFWVGAIKTNRQLGENWSLPFITSYYFLLVVASSFLNVHIEEDISEVDIKEGGLVKYLLRPISYFWIKFLQEIPYRILQGGYGFIVCILFVIFFGKVFAFSNDIVVIILSICIASLAYFLSFTYKMIIGLLSFWIVDLRGASQVIEIIFLIFAGFIIPLELLPDILSKISYILPFSYMIYFPVIAFQGKLEIIKLVSVIGTQFIWLGILIGIYKILWNKGIKKFTGVGQ